MENVQYQDQVGVCTILHDRYAKMQKSAIPTIFVHPREHDQNDHFTLPLHLVYEYHTPPTPMNRIGITFYPLLDRINNIVRIGAHQP